VRAAGKVVSRFEARAGTDVETSETCHIGGKRVTWNTYHKDRLFVCDDPGAGNDAFRRDGRNNVEGAPGISD